MDSKAKKGRKSITSLSYNNIQLLTIEALDMI